MKATPTPHEVMEMIMQAARVQIAASTEAQAIVAAGLGAHLDEIMASTAANAAHVIHWAFDAEVSPTQPNP